LPVCVRQIDQSDGFYKADIEFLKHHGCHAADFRRQQQIKSSRLQKNFTI
jgi:hypothetical protein